MTQNTNAPAAPAEPSPAASDNAQPTTKTRRLRRMAREVGSATPPAVPAAAAPETPPVSATPKAESKIARVIALLAREPGATLAELTQATGWQPHTTRAALTGLRKKAG